MTNALALLILALDRHRLDALPPDTAIPPTVFVIPASGALPATLRYAF